MIATDVPIVLVAIFVINVQHVQTAMRLVAQYVSYVTNVSVIYIVLTVGFVLLMQIAFASAV